MIKKLLLLLVLLIGYSQMMIAQDTIRKKTLPILAVIKAQKDTILNSDKKKNDIIDYAKGIKIPDLNEVVISGFHLNDSLQTVPAAVSVLTNLQRNNNTDIAPLLNTLPGVQMQSGALNTNRISIRGIGARTTYGTNKIRAFYGNIPLTTGDSETTIEDIDLEAIQKVEVIKGPFSSIYGAGLGGA
ncbi:MAG: TonB-dependent receptor plug domain-containing protein, partial [Flavobacterium sp.]